MFTKTLNFLRSLDVVLPFFIFVFKFFFQIYQELLVYLIARLNLAISKVRNFGMGLIIKQVWGSVGKNWGSIENLGKLWVVG